MEKENFLVATTGIAEHPIAGLDAVRTKPLHWMTGSRVWSALVRIEAGSALPEHRTDGVCEIMIVGGGGRVAGGRSLAEGDYLRECDGTYSAIEAEQNLLLFVVHRGFWAFHTPDGAWVRFSGASNSARRMQ
ncbi:MAG: hypothetical protein AAF721_07995 [Myxococcota bacterium]